MEENTKVTTAEGTTQEQGQADAGENGLLEKLKALIGIGGEKQSETDQKEKKDVSSANGQPAETSGEPKTEGKKNFSQEELNAAVKKAKEDLLAQQAEEAAEKKRLEKMTPEERKEDALKQADAKSAKLEAELMRMKLEKQASELLTEKKLPAGLSKVLSYESEESLKKSLETVEAAFKSEVEAEVNAKLKGKTPVGLGSSANVGENMISAEIAKRIAGGI